MIQHAPPTITDHYRVVMRSDDTICFIICKYCLRQFDAIDSSGRRNWIGRSHDDMKERYANDPPNTHPAVRGRCPSCGAESLFLGSNGYVTCSVLGCKDPGAVHDLLASGAPPPPEGTKITWDAQGNRAAPPYAIGAAPPPVQGTKITWDEQGNLIATPYTIGAVPPPPDSRKELIDARNRLVKAIVGLRGGHSTVVDDFDEAIAALDIAIGKAFMSPPAVSEGEPQA